MSNPISKFLFSTRLMAILFVLFAIAMAAGTFIEDATDIETARVYIYNTKWFEAIMVFFAINFFGNIARYKLYKKEKWSVLLLHLSFLFIIIGAGITRYIGDEGVLPLREGESADFYLSDETYLTVFIDGEMDGEPVRRTLQHRFLFSENADNFYANNDFEWNYEVGGKKFSISYANFIKGAEERFVSSESGDEYLKIVEAGDGNRHEHYLKNGENASIHNLIFSLNNPAKGAINIRTTDSIYTIESPFAGSFMRMADQLQGQLVADTIQPLMLRSLYQAGGLSFVIPEKIVRGKYDYVELPENEATKNSEDLLELQIKVGDRSQNVKMLGGKGVINNPQQISLDGLDFYFTFGSVRRQLPFEIHLNDFIADKYPGTEKSYSSFMSKIQVNDDKPFDYDIYMNHVLDYKGYRFFQSSFMPDEKGTILSINHDAWGTNITYLGYFLLYAGLMAIMFFGKTRFKDLGDKLKKIKQKRGVLTVAILIMSSISVLAQEETHTHTHNEELKLPTKQEIIDNIHATTVSPEHAEKFGRLIIQDGGRMQPINTFASELLRKLSKKDSYEGMSPDQVLLSIMQDPSPWVHVPLLAIKKQNDSLHRFLGLEKNAEYVRIRDLYDMEGNYKLEPVLEDAYRAAVPNQFQKEFKDLDLKRALFYRALSGEIIKIYPVPGDENNSWISKPDYLSNPEVVKDTLYANFIKNSLPYYVSMLRNAKINGNYAEADTFLKALKQNQLNYGKDLMPSEDKINAEILYNKYNIFEKLFLWYMMAGPLMLIFLITQIFVDNKWIRLAITFFKGVIICLFLLHTAGLIVRWYVSGHAPWSNAYESIIYVGWATMGMGLLFIRKSNLTVASTAFVTCVILMIAQSNWTDPGIGNLKPVLDSYWLMIHVAVIVASYGPFTLGFVLGLLTLFLYLITTESFKKKIDLAIQEITIVNELSLTVGLVMLTIGNFLGGQWANESWGRYWGWDPKETWALISIMVYAFVVHMRLVPGLRGRYAFSLGSVVAYASIMMTYFGVNFYLSGLHSYAEGEFQASVLYVVYIPIAILSMAGVAYWRYRVHFKK